MKQVISRTENATLVKIILQQSDQVYDKDEGAQLLVIAAGCLNEKIVDLLINHGMRVIDFLATLLLSIC